MDKKLRDEDFIKDSAIMNGIVMKTISLEGVENLPITVFPTPYPEELFHLVVDLQTDFNLIFNKLGRDYDVLNEILKNAIKTDDFLQNLWHIYNKVLSQPNHQNIFLSLVRNDYMVSAPDNIFGNILKVNKRSEVTIKQIEYNLIASGFAGMSQNIYNFHQLNLKLENIDNYAEIIDKMPISRAVEGFGKGLFSAWNLYNKTNSVILIVVGTNDRNIFDQRIIEQYLHEEHPSIIIIRRTFEQISNNGYLRTDNSLWIDDFEIAVVYFRHGYAPEHFPNKKTWECKLMMEMSMAIKCPSIHQLLVNTKLVQQALCDCSLLTKYLPYGKAKNLIETFANQHLLSDINKVQEALENPSKFVLKPQREGGGNNYFDDELLKKLKQVMNNEEKYQFVLMERIYPNPTENQLLTRENKICKKTIVSELGIYGVFLGSLDEVYENFQCGHILRSMPFDAQEGGVTLGAGFLDSPYLVKLGLDKLT